MLHKNSDEGKITIANERHEMLQNKTDEGNASIMQDFEDVEEMEMNKNSATDDSNSDDLLENNSSQESQSGRKLVVTSSRRKIRREEKVKKFNCKKEASAKVLWGNSHHTLAHHQKKVRMEDCGNSRKIYDTITSENGKVGAMLPSMTFQLITKTKKCVSKE